MPRASERGKICLKQFTPSPISASSALVSKHTTHEPISTRNLGHVTGYQPIRDQYFLYPSVPDTTLPKQLFDKIKPGCVNWPKVNKPPFKALGGKMKQIENCNYAIALGKEIGFVLVGR
eukprot:sb/3476358/